MSKKKKGCYKKSPQCLHKTIPSRMKRKNRGVRRRIRSLENSLIHEISYEINENKSASKTENVVKNARNLKKLLQSNLENQETISQESSEQPPLEKTIDLCAEESTDCIIEKCSTPQKVPEVIIDLSKEQSDDVIIVNENLDKSSSACDKNNVTIVIDEDDEQDMKPICQTNEVNDDVLVIGSFSKIPFSSSPSNKMNDFVKCIVQINKKRMRDIPFKCHESVLRNTKFPHKRNRPGVSSRLIKPDLGNCIGGNVYTENPIELPKTGLRPIIIDGSNVAYGFSNKQFSCKRLQICIKYFKERGHKVTAFVPQFRTQHLKSDDPGLLNKMVEKGDVILTPSRRVEGKNIVPYDDRFIVQAAVLQGGIIVSRDNYRDLLAENPAWAETINYRTLPYTWVGDVLMFPNDPLGEHGPSLDEFLRFN